MTWPEADRKLAAALLLAMDYGGRPVEHVASVLDREIADRAVVPTWLIDASLLRSPQDMANALENVAEQHPLVEDPVSALEMLALGWEHGLRSAKRVIGLSSSLAREDRLPDDLSTLAYEAEEEQEVSGLTQPDRVERAVRQLLTAARGRSAWTAVLRQVVATSDW